MLYPRPFLSSSTLKLLAITFMVIDHIGLLFFPEDPTWRIIGRLSFPLFAFLIAEGYAHTSNLRTYATRLFIFALISQAPYMLFIGASGESDIPLNIFFTLLVGLLALAILQRLPMRHSLPLFFGLCLLVVLIPIDYGLYGVLTILASHLVRTKRALGLTLLFALPVSYALFMAEVGVFSIQFLAIFSIPLILAYNGTRGVELPRYLFYSFYPVHFLILFGVWAFLS